MPCAREGERGALSSSWRAGAAAPRACSGCSRRLQQQAAAAGGANLAGDERVDTDVGAHLVELRPEDGVAPDLLLVLARKLL
jgi:hypothetical protein